VPSRHEWALSLAYCKFKAPRTSIGLFIATSVLVIVTFIYAYYTKKLFEVTDQTRREQIKPKIKSSLHFIGPVFAVLRCQNIGRGSAKELDVNIEFYPQSGTSIRTWKEPILLPLEFRDFLLPFKSLDDIQSNIDYIIVKGECKDAFDAKEIIYDRLDVREYLANLKAAHIRVVETADEYLKYIAKNTEKIAGSLDEIKRKLPSHPYQFKQKARLLSSFHPAHFLCAEPSADREGGSYLRLHSPVRTARWSGGIIIVLTLIVSEVWNLLDSSLLILPILISVSLIMPQPSSCRQLSGSQEQMSSMYRT